MRANEVSSYYNLTGHSGGEGFLQEINKIWTSQIAFLPSEDFQSEHGNHELLVLVLCVDNNNNSILQNISFWKCYRKNIFAKLHLNYGFRKR